MQTRNIVRTVRAKLPPCVHAAQPMPCCSCLWLLAPVTNVIVSCSRVQPGRVLVRTRGKGSVITCGQHRARQPSRLFQTTFLLLASIFGLDLTQDLTCVQRRKPIVPTDPVVFCEMSVVCRLCGYNCGKLEPSKYNARASFHVRLVTVTRSEASARTHTGTFSASLHAASRTPSDADALHARKYEVLLSACINPSFAQPPRFTLSAEPCA